MKTFVDRATPEHARELAKSLRPEDEAECRALGYATGAEALEQGVASSILAWSVFFDGQVGAIVGLDQRNPERPMYIWCLTGRVVDRAKFAFWRISKEIVETFRSTVGPLYCVTDRRYGRARAWLERLGFKAGEELAVDGVMFDSMSIGGL